MDNVLNLVARHLKLNSPRKIIISMDKSHCSSQTKPDGKRKQNFMVNLRSYKEIRYIAKLVTLTAPCILTHTFLHLIWRK